ncbi:MAG: thioredoxin family protein [Solirubrobacterales bacterium]
MSSPVTEQNFAQLVLERSQELPVVVDFWAAWCGPCKALSPTLEAAAAARQGKVELVEVDVDANQGLAAQYMVQGIPAVKAFRDGVVVDEFTGALPPARVEAFFDKLVPSRGDELLAAGDELSLREATELEPARADVAVALAKARLERGAEDEALEAVKAHDGDFAAAGITARIRLARAGLGADSFAALDRGERDAAIDGLIETLSEVNHGSEGPTDDLDPEEARDLLRRAIVGILSEGDPSDATSRIYRRKLAAALS